MLSKIIAASVIVAGSDAIRVESLNFGTLVNNADALGASARNSISDAFGQISDALQSNTTTQSTTVQSNTTTSSTNTSTLIPDTEEACRQLKPQYQLYQGLPPQTVRFL